MATPSPSAQVALLPAPPGYVVDFDHPQRRGLPAGYWICGVGLLLSSSFLAMRVYTKLRLSKDFKLEDCGFPYLAQIASANSLRLYRHFLRMWYKKCGVVSWGRFNIDQAFGLSVQAIILRKLH